MGPSLLLTLLLGAVASSGVSAKQLPTNPVVRLWNGLIKGVQKTTAKGTLYKSFESLPYAEPPTGHRRFKEPVFYSRTWNGVWDATEPNKGCLRYDQSSPYYDETGEMLFRVSGQEDCLYLNVYVPNAGKKKMNVLVWFHGGGFMFGKAGDSAPDFIMDEGGVIIVIMNYRVGPMGFLSTGDRVVPGNNGLKDQVMALKWVQKNIVAFGGSPDKVTIAGLSAGASSVFHQFLSPLSDGLFRGGWSYSGTALGPSALRHDVPEKTKKLAALLACPTSPSSAMVRCLRQRPGEKLVGMMKHFQVMMYIPYGVFGPVVEPAGTPNPFLDDLPINIIKDYRSKNLPYVTGSCDADGLYPAEYFVGNQTRLSALDEQWSHVAPHLLFFNDTVAAKHKEMSINKVRSLYINGKLTPNTDLALIKMVSDRLFIGPSTAVAKLQAAHSSAPVYAYYFSFCEPNTSSLMKLANITICYGAAHGDDSMFVVKLLGNDPYINARTESIGKLMKKLMITFIKTGSMPEYWEPVDRDPKHPFRFLDILTGDNYTMKIDDNHGNVDQLAEAIPEGPLTDVNK